MDFTLAEMNVSGRDVGVTKAETDLTPVRDEPNTGGDEFYIGGDQSNIGGDGFYIGGGQFNIGGDQFYIGGDEFNIGGSKGNMGHKQC